MFKKSNILLLAIPMLSLPASIFATTLNEIVDDTLTTNPTIQKEMSNLKSTQYDLDGSYSGYKPTLNLSGGIGIEKTKREHTTASTTIDKQLTRREAGVNFTQNIFEGFTTSADIDEKKKKVTAAQFQVLQSANTLALTTTENYLQVIYQKELLRLLKENVQTHERIFKMIQQKADSGIGRRSDIEQTEGRVTLAYSNYIAQLKNYQLYLVTFEKIYGKSLSAKDLLMPELPDLPSTSLEDLESLAAEYSPTLHIEKENIEGSKASYEKGKSKYYPVINADLSAQWNNNISGVEGENDSYQAMLRASWNLYNGGSDESVRLKALENVTNYKHSYDEQNRNILEILRQAYLTEEILKYQIRCLEKHVTLTKKTTDSYKKEFLLGRRNLLDLLNVELEYNSAKQQLLTAENERITSRYKILSAIGILPYALKSDIYAKANMSEPTDINFDENNVTDVTLLGENEDFLDLSEVCMQTPKPKVEETIEPEPVMEEPEPIVEETPPPAEVVKNDIQALQATENADNNESNQTTVVMDSVFFTYKSTQLADEAKKHLKYVADYLKTQKDTILIIYGYSDSIGSEKYNKKLSLQRAENVKKELVKLGIDPNNIQAIGMGEANPIADNATAAGREKNRRIEFKLVHNKTNNKEISKDENITKSIQTKDIIIKEVPKEGNTSTTIQKNDSQIKTLKAKKHLSDKEKIRLQTLQDIKKNIELEMNEDEIEAK